MTTTPSADRARLEEIRAAIRAESVSYGEIAELQGMSDLIDSSDLELLEWAGVPEHPAQSLSDLMEFGRIIGTDGTGHVYADYAEMDLGEPAPEEVQYVDLDDDGGAPDPVAPDGWEYLTGFTGQYGYHGSVMHDSEYIGGGLERHILETPGYYVAVVIEGWTPERVDHTCPFPDDCEEAAVDVGWGILRYVGGAR